MSFKTTYYLQSKYANILIYCDNINPIINPYNPRASINIKDKTIPTYKCSSWAKVLIPSSATIPIPIPETYYNY